MARYLVRERQQSIKDFVISRDMLREIDQFKAHNNIDMSRCSYIPAPGHAPDYRYGYEFNSELDLNLFLLHFNQWFERCYI